VFIILLLLCHDTCDVMAITVELMSCDVCVVVSEGNDNEYWSYPEVVQCGI